MLHHPMKFIVEVAAKTKRLRVKNGPVEVEKCESERVGGEKENMLGGARSEEIPSMSARFLYDMECSKCMMKGLQCNVNVCTVYILLDVCSEKLTSSSLPLSF